MLHRLCLLCKFSPRTVWFWTGKIEMCSQSDSHHDQSPTTLEPYQWQIAGHMISKTDPDKRYVGLLRDRETHHILKPWQPAPRGDCEIRVYERIWSDDGHGDPRLHSLRPLVPKYFGARTVSVNGASTKFLELDDVTANMQKPCITDIKIGAQTWDPTADPEKIMTEQTKYAPYAERLCFRFLGMMVYQVQPGNYLVRDKQWGKTVTDNDVIPAFADYFSAAGQHRLAVIDHVIEKLRSIERWFSKPAGSAFYSSSVLIAYDAASEGLLNHQSAVHVRMIDFTHVFDHQGCDMNYLNGIRSLIRHLELYKESIVEK